MLVAYVIRWSLLGSYICLITTQWTTVVVFIAEETVQLVDTKLLLLVGKCGSCSELWLWTVYYERLTVDSKLLHCTVQFLKYVPVAGIIGWWVWEPGILDLRWGSLLQCSRQLEWAYILGPFNLNSQWPKTICACLTITKPLPEADPRFPL